MILDDETLARIAAARVAAGKPPIAPEAMRDIAEHHALGDDPTFDMALHLATLPEGGGG